MTGGLRTLLERLTGRGQVGGAATIVPTSLLSMGIRVFGLLIALATQAYLSRLLGVAEFGRYAIALGWTMLLVIVARRGLDDMALRVATHYIEDGSTGHLAGLVRYAVRTMAGAVLAMLAIAVAVKFAAPGLAAGFSWPMILSVAMAVLSLAMLGFYSALLLSSGRVAASQAFEQVWRPIILILLLFASHLLWNGPGSADTAMALTAASLVAAVLLATIVWRRGLPADRAKPSATDRAEWHAISSSLIVLALAQEGLNQAGLLLLGILSSNIDAAHFAAAWRFNSLLIFGLAAVGLVSGPLIASAYRRADKAELAAIVRTGARFSLAFAAAGAAVLILAGRPLLALFGPEFTIAYPVLMILLVGSTATAATGAVPYLLSLTGSHGLAAKIIAAVLLICVIANVLLIPAYGAVGAAIAVSVAQVLRSLALLYFARRVTGVWSWPLAGA